MTGPALVRLPDWEARLFAWFDQVEHMPHDYGRHDCALFIAGSVAAMTGVDLADGYRGKYRSAAGSVRVLKAAGAGSVADLLTDALGPPQHIAFGHRGDVCLFGGVPGILMTDHGVFVGQDDGAAETCGIGLVRVPRPALTRDACWAVPFAAVTDV